MEIHGDPWRSVEGAMLSQPAHSMDGASIQMLPGSVESAESGESGSSSQQNGSKVAKQISNHMIIHDSICDASL